MFDTLFGFCIVDVDGRLAGGGFARTDGCAAVDAARGLFNGAAGDGDGGVSGGSHAAADACAAGGLMYIAAGDGEAFAAVDAAAASAAFGAAAGGLLYPAAGDVQGAVAADAVARLAAFGCAAGGLLYPAGDGEAVAGGNACAAGVLLAGAGGVAADGFFDDPTSWTYKCTFKNFWDFLLINAPVSSVPASDE